MSRELNLLLLEDDAEDAALIQKLLRRSGMECKMVVAGDAEEFLNAIDTHKFDAVLCDNALPQYSSLEALDMIKVRNPHTAFILVTGTVSEDFAVSIIQQGADDYILKNNLTRLPAAINKAIEKKRIELEKETEKKLSDSIINSLPGVFYFYDENGTILRWNKNFEDFSGFSSTEISNMLPEDFFDLRNKEYVRKWIDRIFEKGSAEIEAEIRTKTGKKIPFYFTGSAIRFNGRRCLVGIGLDITARKQAEKELKKLNESLRNLSAHLERIKEDEQARIAREIHDQLGQQMTAIKMEMSWVKRKLTNYTIDADINEKLTEMMQLTDEAVAIIRRVASELRPSILDDFGLKVALEWQSREFERRSGVNVEFTGPENDTAINPEIAIGLFRIYQEALTNVARHAEATHVFSELEFKDRQLRLTITDDGKGFESSKHIHSLGLLGIKERGHIIGGTVTISSEPNKGTTIAVSVPFR